MNKTTLLKSAWVVLALGVSQMSWADAVSNLQARLSGAQQYSADFSQTVRSAKGKVVQQGQGKFYVKRPNLFRLETKGAQQNTVVSDGKTVWFYDPFVEQVTANWLSNVVSNTPFALLASNEAATWSQYSVSQSGDKFKLIPKSKKSTIKSFEINIDAKSVLKGFSTVERDGQTNSYQLRNVSNQAVNASLFQFSVPKGVELDDQRSKGKK